MKARENPFRSERLDALVYRAEGFDWPTLEARLVKLGGCGAIVGPEGHGKSTLLREWHKRSTESALVKLEFRQRRLTQEQRNEVGASKRVFLDSAEQLGWWGWIEFRCLTHRADLVVITSHRTGRLPTLLRCRTSPELLGDLIYELSGANYECHNLWKQHKGNIRHALRALYDSNSARR